MENSCMTGLGYDDIMPGCRWAMSVETGRTRNPNGSWHRNTHMVEYFDTPDGKVEVNEWRKFAEERIFRNGDQKLYDAILEHVGKLAWLLNTNDDTKRLYACECLVIGAWKAWKERGEFDFEESPVVLDQASADWDIFSLWA